MKLLYTIIISLSGFVCIFQPTSEAAIIFENNLRILLPPILIVLIIWSVQRKTFCPDKLQVGCQLVVFLSLLIGTALSPFLELTYGSVVPYFTLGLLFNTRIVEPAHPAIVIASFVILSLLLLILGYLVVAENEATGTFLTDYYSQAYDGMVARMIFLGKPVATFGSHSSAAFFLFAVFYINLKAFELLGRHAFLLLALAFFPLIILTASTSGLFFGFISCGVLFSVLRRECRPGLLLVGLPIFAVVLFYFYNYIDLSAPKYQRFDFFSDSFGINSRYAEGGALEGTLAYIFDNPFRPIGITYSDVLFYTDSGYLVNMLRGSLPLMVAVYVGFVSFLRNNIRDRVTRNEVIFFFMLFEVGFPNLFYFRTPLFLVLLCSCFKSLDLLKK